jgi:hypothetical protein
MRSDLAALTPPLVMAVAFIAGVVALLRREMAPRRRDRMVQQDETVLPAGPDGETTSPEYAQMPGGAQNGAGKDRSDGNSGNSDVAGCGTQLLSDKDDDVINPVSEDHPPASPEA